MNALSALVVDPAFALAFRVREPASAEPSAMLVLLHGVGGNEANLAELAAGIAPDTLVVLPRGRLELGAGQYAWFRVAFTAEGPQIVASEAEDSRTALLRFVAQLQAVHGIAPERTIIAGFSQGGILSASVGLTAPEYVRGFAVLAGRILPELEPRLAPRERLAGLHALVAHGRDDEKLPVAWAERADAWLEQLGVTHAMWLYPGGHGINATMARDFQDWVEQLLPPVASTLQLRIGPESTWFEGGATGSGGVRIAPGSARLVREHFGPHVPLQMALESAIAAIEEELASVPRMLHGASIASSDPALHAIAAAAGMDDTASTLHRDAVEHAFARLAAVAGGRPAGFDSLSEDPHLAAALLLVRELMHHLDIATITLRQPTTKESIP